MNHTSRNESTGAAFVSSSETVRGASITGMFDSSDRTRNAVQRRIASGRMPHAAAAHRIVEIVHVEQEPDQQPTSHRRPDQRNPVCTRSAVHCARVVKRHENVVRIAGEVDAAKFFSFAELNFQRSNPGG